MDSTNQERRPAVARTHCDVFLGWPAMALGMAKLYKCSIFVITEKHFAIQCQVT